MWKVSHFCKMLSNYQSRELRQCRVKHLVIVTTCRCVVSGMRSAQWKIWQPVSSVSFFKSSSLEPSEGFSRWHWCGAVAVSCKGVKQLLSCYSSSFQLLTSKELKQSTAAVNLHFYYSRSFHPYFQSSKTSMIQNWNAKLWFSWWKIVTCLFHHDAGAMLRWRPSWQEKVVCKVVGFNYWCIHSCLSAMIWNWDLYITCREEMCVLSPRLC